MEYMNNFFFIVQHLHDWDWYSSANLGEPEDIAKTDINRLKICVMGLKRFVGL